MKPIALHISCPYAVNAIPPDARHLFAADPSILNTHLAFDIGAIEVADALQKKFQCTHTQTVVSRLLIDCTHRVPDHRCFSSITQTLSTREQQRLINQYYSPYQEQTQAFIRAHVERGAQVLHLCIGSFPLQRNGIKQNTALGLLYDHTRHGEQEVARIWKSLLLQQTPTYRVRLNYPSHGAAEGLVHQLRKQYSEHDYLGLSLLFNQALLSPHSSQEELLFVVASSLEELLQVL